MHGAAIPPWHLNRGENLTLSDKRRGAQGRAATDGDCVADEAQRHTGRFLPGNKPKNAFPPGHKPVNEQGADGKFREKERREAGRGGRLDKQPEPTPEEISLADRAARAKITTLETENTKMRRLLGLIDSYHVSATEPPKWLAAEKGKRNVSDRLAVACMQLSDLHLDEVVDPAQVGGLNAFNRAIAELRLKRWADKVCELGDLHRHRWEGAVLFFQGDVVSGSIHDELLCTNEDVLPSTITHYAPILAAAFKQVADFYGSMHVCTVVGNHGRLTLKKQAKNRGRNSWDWLIGELIKSHLRDEKHITWDVSQGSYLFVPVYQQTYHVVHGDGATGGGGWSGVWSPLGKIHRSGIELGAAHGIRGNIITISGHWHQLTLAHHRGIVVNGALKGWDEYAAFLHLRPEPALQSWWVNSATHGVTLAAPVFVEDRKAEGW